MLRAVACRTHQTSAGLQRGRTLAGFTQPHGQPSPAISEGGRVLNLAEGRVDPAELPSEALDGRSDVRPITVLPGPGDETFVVLDVINLSISQVVTDVRHEKMDDAVFADGEADIHPVPIGPMDGMPEDELAADDGPVDLGIGGRLAGFEGEPEATGQNLHAACLVYEVDRASLQGELLVRRLGMARQEHHRQGHAALAQLGQQVDARNSRKPPVEDDDIGLGGSIERAEQRVAIVEAANGKAMPLQFTTDNLAVDLVVFDDKDADGIRIALRDAAASW